MKDLFTGIYTQYNSVAGTTLSSQLTGGFYLGEAPSTAVMPYAVYNLVNTNHDPNWTAKYDDTVLDIALYSDSTAGAVEITNIYESVKTVFDDSKITVSGHANALLKREYAWLNKLPDIIPDKSVWQYVVQYRVLTRENT